jgi:hypothetical protein
MSTNGEQALVGNRIGTVWTISAQLVSISGYSKSVVSNRDAQITASK